MTARYDLLTTNLQNVWSQEDFIINLIKCDLIHTKQLQGFRNMNLDCGYYVLPIYESIIWAMGIWEAEPKTELAEWYFDVTGQVDQIQIPDLEDKTSILAKKIFIDLEKKCKKIKRKNRQTNSN